MPTCTQVIGTHQQCIWGVMECAVGDAMLASCVWWGGGGGNEGVGWYVQRWVVRVQGVGCGVWDKENEGVRCAG